MLNVGLTGGIGSGKSTVSQALAARGAILIDSDVLAREVVAPGTDGLAAVVAEFGAAVLAPDGSLDRPALGAVVFADETRRAALNAIVHPRVRARSAEIAAAAGPGDVVVNDIPLLVETGLADRFEVVVVVDAADEVRLRRLAESRGMSAEEARARMSAQATREERLAAADVVLDNNGTPEELEAQVDRLWKQLRERAAAA
ncbi:dephospho-CoA kinase [Mangrovactinospora gilvigrisea]|uniref:Dephospho-CoA kinase n=1 Tax=Mangrovactinospora gilvigrisea TaxID=1428644 RepID=A0A1J7BB74_9ACTN|nr:dephospho-CoA kinase [Mangrovactinospora gilvigrisea]OIV35870.1 dephospho-CoA kinase [Mangrovactinospora gilvigrisea]